MNESLSVAEFEGQGPVLAKIRFPSKFPALQTPLCSKRNGKQVNKGDSGLVCPSLGVTAQPQPGSSEMLMLKHLTLPERNWQSQGDDFHSAL